MSKSDSLLQRLLRAPEAEIVSALGSVRARRERLELEEQVLQGLLDLARSGMTADQRGDLVNEFRRDDARIESPDGPSVVFEAKTGRSKRALILDVMGTDPGRLWRAADVRDAVLARGVEMSPENVRVTLRRMSQAGELGRVGQGKFRLRQPGEAA